LTAALYIPIKPLLINTTSISFMDEGALRLYAYVYNAGKVTAKELGIITIGATMNCRIKVTPAAYLFTWGDQQQAMPRLSTTEKGKGYQLYPYFGGDEAAPHDISIWIKSL
jgi:hypothetical protein